MGSRYSVFTGCIVRGLVALPELCNVARHATEGGFGERLGRCILRGKAGSCRVYPKGVIRVSLLGRGLVGALAGPVSTLLLGLSGRLQSHAEVQGFLHTDWVLDMRIMSSP